MDIKKLKTSQLLDQIEDTDDDSLFDDLLNELWERVPFGGESDRMEDIEGMNEKLEKEIEKLKTTLKKHTHIESGKSVIEI